MKIIVEFTGNTKDEIMKEIDEFLSEYDQTSSELLKSRMNSYEKAAIKTFILMMLKEQTKKPY